MDITRRHVLTGGLALAALAAFPRGYGRAAAKSARAHYLVAGAGLKEKGAVMVVDTETASVLSIPTGFQPHSFLQNPRSPERVWAIERWGAHAAEVDILTGKLVRTLVCDDHHQFYGHGFFAADQETLFISRVNLDSGHGHLVGFNANTGKQEVNHRVTKGGLHQVELLPDASVLIASSGVYDLSYGKQARVRRVEPTSLVRVRLSDGERLDQKVVMDAHQIIGHYLRYGENALLVFSTAIKNDAGVPLAPHGYVYTGTLDSAELKPLAWDAQAEAALRGEMLSVAVNGKKTHALVTNPDGKKAVMIDLSTGKYRFMLDLPAKGVAYYAARDAFLATGEQGLFRVRDSMRNATDTEATGWMMRREFTSSHNAIFSV